MIFRMTSGEEKYYKNFKEKILLVLTEREIGI